VSPRLELGQVSAIRERDVHGVERNDEILGVEELGKGVDDSGLRADIPGEALREGAESAEVGRREMTAELTS